MTRVLSLRLDEAAERALAELTEHGVTAAVVVRQALLDAARRRRRELARAQAQQVAADPDDRAEMAAVRADLDDIRAW